MWRGIKKAMAAGEFNDTYTAANLWQWMRTNLIDAEFVIETEGTNSNTQFMLVTAGPAYNIDDTDAPRWLFWMNTTTAGSEWIEVVPVASPLRGGGTELTLLYAETISGSTTVFSAEDFDPAPALTVWFAADGRSGAWHFFVVADYGATGVSREYGLSGLASRRYASDMSDDACARYGVLDHYSGQWIPAWCKISDGAGNWSHAVTVENPIYFASWSPIGVGNLNANWKRDPATAVQKMAAPAFPSINKSYAPACVLGEFRDILVCTDGYAQDEIIGGKWVVMAGGVNDQPIAIPVPLYDWVDPTIS